MYSNEDALDIEGISPQDARDEPYWVPEDPALDTICESCE